MEFKYSYEEKTEAVLRIVNDGSTELVCPHSEAHKYCKKVLTK